jgi:hypothetical protein
VAGSAGEDGRLRPPAAGASAAEGRALDVLGAALDDWVREYNAARPHQSLETCRPVTPAELGPYAPLVIFAVGTGVRPEEAALTGATSI